MVPVWLSPLLAVLPGHNGATAKAVSAPSAAKMVATTMPVIQKPRWPQILTPDDLEQRKKVDDAIAAGLSPEDAHQQAHGEVDTADTKSKSDFASTLGRVQNATDKKGVYVEPGSTSLLARDEEMSKTMDKVTPDDLRTPQPKEVPDQLQSLDKQEDYDYNLDVAYLQKYGRA